MSVDIERKFKLQGLGQEDEPMLFENIKTTRSGTELLSFIYIYGKSFPENDTISSICDHYIKNPIPGLTAVCMQVMIDFWNHSKKYLDIIEKFLDPDLIEEWYDEIIFSVSYVSNNKSILPDKIRNRFDLISRDSTIIELGIL